MKKFILALMLISICSCENLTFSNINRRSNQSILLIPNNTSSNQSSKAEVNDDEIVIDDHLKLFNKALTNNLKDDYEYHISSCYDNKSYIEEKVVQVINKKLWYKESEVIYNLNSSSLSAFLQVDEVGYVRYIDNDVDKDNFSHLSWVEKFMNRFVEEFIIEEPMKIDSNVIDYSQYHISSYYEEIDGREGLIIVLQPQNEGYKEYYKLTLFTSGVENTLEVKNNYISSDDYYSLLMHEASKIEISHEYQFLQKINSYPSSDKYYNNPGFGIDSYSDIKYGFEDFYQAFNRGEELVAFAITSYPDCFISKGNHVTSMDISDKEITFNGLTLNSEVEDIISHFVDTLKYKNTTTQQDNKVIHTFYKYGIIIRLVVVDNIAISISFDAPSSNVFNIVY